MSLRTPLSRLTGRIISRLPTVQRLRTEVAELERERTELYLHRDRLAGERDELAGHCRRLESERAEAIQLHQRVAVERDEIAVDLSRVRGDLAAALGRERATRADLVMYRMRLGWDMRALREARHPAPLGQGEAEVREHVLADLESICRGRNPRQMRILELGCGPGRMTRALAAVFGEVHAVDFSDDVIEAARVNSAGLENVVLHVSTPWDLSVVPPWSFDSVLAAALFEQAEGWPAVEYYLREVHRVLKPGGLFKLRVSPALPSEEAGGVARSCGFEAERCENGWLWMVRD